MAAPSRTGGLTAVAAQSVAGLAVVKSADIDLSVKIGAMFYAWFGRGSASAGGAGANTRIDVSPKTSGDDSWTQWGGTFTSAFAACEAEAVNGTCAAGQPVVPVALTANLTVGDLICIVNATPSLSEWGRIKAISANVSVTLEDNLTNAQTGSTLYDAAEFYSPVWVSGVMRARVVYDAANFTQTSLIKVLYDTEDTFA